MSTHYETLGIADTATADEIKSAYRKLAMQWHPDKNQGNTAAESKFKEINAAHEILSDNNKRREYDMQRSGFGPTANGQHWNMNVNGNPFGAGPLDDFVAQFFNQQGFGGFRHQPQRNRDVTLNMTISLDDAYTGKQTGIQFNTASGRRVELLIDVPKGIDTDTKIRYTGQGDQANSGLPPGDLYINIIIADHDTFTRHAANLECTASIDAIAAIVGTKHRVTAIDGHIINITIPQGTQAGTRLRLPGQGMPMRENPKVFGDLIVTVSLSIPTTLTADDLNQLRQIQTNRRIDTI